MARKLVSTTTTTTTDAAPALVATGAQAVRTPSVPAPKAIPALIPATGGYRTGTTQAVAPAPGSVFAAMLAQLAIDGGASTPEACQAAITAVGRKGTHDWLVLARWQARNRGWAFSYHEGKVRAYPSLDAYREAGY